MSNKTHRNPTSSLVISFSAILICGLFLFSLDHETNSFSDLFKPQNLFSLALYSIPTLLICSLIKIWLDAKAREKTLLKSLLIGIPGGFTLMILTLGLLMGRF